jgi:CheY-like chemotaxis protein
MTNQRIVLIDDSDADILLLKMCLDEIAPDHQLTVLKDGAAALRFCKAEREQTRPLPCVVVVDIHLPKHDGIEILEAICQSPALCHLKPLLVSSSPSPAQQKRIEELGVPFVERPASLDKCEAFARRILALSDASQGVTA